MSQDIGLARSRESWLLARRSSTLGAAWSKDWLSHQLVEPSAIDSSAWRDAADGGLGFHLVGRLSAASGWTVRDDRQHVWAGPPRRRGYRAAIVACVARRIVS